MSKKVSWGTYFFIAYTSSSLEIWGHGRAATESFGHVLQSLAIRKQ